MIVGDLRTSHPGLEATGVGARSGVDPDGDGLTVEADTGWWSRLVRPPDGSDLVAYLSSD